MEEALTITQLTERVDKLDDFLHEDVLMVTQDNSVSELVTYFAKEKFNIEKGGEYFIERNFRAVSALLKANAHLRNYERLTPLLVKEIKKDTPEKSNADTLFEKVDYLIEFEGFLTQIKTALDLLAQGMKPTIGKFFQTYGKAKISPDQVERSGISIYNYIIRSLPADTKLKPIATLILKNSEEITKIVQLRDDYVHSSHSKLVQGFRYSVEKHDVFPPLILVNENESDYVNIYMKNTLMFIAQYIQEFNVTLLSNLLNDMIRDRNSGEKWIWKTGH